jgi:probable rRNA maturation factor
MKKVLRVFNRQKTRGVDTVFLRTITQSLLDELTENHELAIHLIDSTRMAQLNEQYLQHAGSTDVITFDYCEGKNCEALWGEIFICIDDAVQQARQFRTTWQSETARYVVHGILHLLGFDDLKPKAKRIMKRRENKLLKELAARLPLGKLLRTSHARKRK